MREPYALKGARTVPGRGEGGNTLSLFDRGRGRSAEGAGGVGAAGEKCMLNRQEARAGRGRNAGEKCMDIPLWRCKQGRNAGKKRCTGDGTKAGWGISHYTCGTCSRARRASMISCISGTVAAG